VCGGCEVENDKAARVSWQKHATTFRSIATKVTSKKDVMASDTCKKRHDLEIGNTRRRGCKRRNKGKHPGMKADTQRSVKVTTRHMRLKGRSGIPSNY
jgi:hypothetical protein